VTTQTIDGARRLTAAVRVPQHVVHRSFPAETVVLNLDTGQYHGLNPIAGRMLDALESAGTIRGAAALLAPRLQEQRTIVERDLLELCDALCERGLLEIDDHAAA
jgi:Coenzyme PQQ synthesis protein D (PqqD)